jgi:3-mercaptopyruvate sulfurtransferase SseA
MRAHVSGRAIAVLLGFAIVTMSLGACGKKPSTREVDVPRITAKEVKDRLDKGQAITFVDARSESAWEEAVAKIPGAIRVPPDEAQKYISDVPKGNPVVVYCT